MRNIQKILIGCFLGGVLLGGIGTGIALVEYASFSYAGEKQLGAEHLVTRNFDLRFEPELGKVEIDRGWWDIERYGIETDDTLPEGTIRYEITYNEEAASPYLVYDNKLPSHSSDEYLIIREGEAKDAEAEAETEDIDRDEDKPADSNRIQGRLDIGMRSTVSDFEMWMLCKDMVLDELRQRRISSYDVAYITDIRVKVNPATLPYVVDGDY